MSGRYNAQRNGGKTYMDNQLALLTLFGSIIALLFVASRAQKVLRFPEGSDRMKKISASIHQGAMAYLRRRAARDFSHRMFPLHL